MFYRAAAVMLEMARASSALNAALQGNATPLAFNSAAYIRADGEKQSS